MKLNAYALCFLLAAAAGEAFALQLVAPEDGATVPLLNPAQKHYLSLDKSVRERYFVDPPGKKPLAFKKYGSYPLPVTLRWKAGQDETAFSVEVVRKPDGKRFFAGTVSGTNAVDVWNLEIGRDWKWSVESGGRRAEGTFSTEDLAPRVLRFDDIKNCRDLGGRIGLDGRRVRQGLLFRTQGLNANAKFKREKGELGKIIEPPTERGKDRLTPETKKYMLEVLGIRTDIDLRNEYETFGMDGSPLGPSVKWEHHSLIAGYSLFRHKMARDGMKELFAIFLDRKNYPIVFHCIGGADRTGAVAFALNALLGVDEDEIFKDYEFTAVGPSFCKGSLADAKHWRLIHHMVDTIRDYPGPTLVKKTENAFKSLGFTDADIETFREIMLEPPPGTEEYAKREFSRFSAGLADVPKVVFARSDAFGDDGYRIVRKGGGPVRVEGGVRGVIYGAYELLERYAGVVFCTSWYTYIPENGRFTMPSDVDFSDKPAFVRREVGWWDAYFRHPAFAVRLRLNGHRAHIPDYMGGAPFRYAAGCMSHTLEHLCPVKKHGKAHPEWFAEIGGVRRIVNTQPCLTNPEVLELVTSNLFAMIANSPDANVFPVTQYDNLNYCRCANCERVNGEEGGPSGTMMRFVNEIADRVAAVWPEKIVQYAAYKYTRKPPKTKPRQNVMVDLSTIDADFALPIAESDAPGCVELRDLVKKWGSLTKWFYIWHYTTNFRYCMHPMPNLHNIAADTRFFRDSGASQLHMQGCWPHAAFASLKQWLVAKTSWNPDADADALIATFCRAYYGAGAPFVLEIIADEERCLMARKKPRLSIFAFDEPQKFPDALLERTLARWRKALAAVEGDSWRTHHVRMGELATVATLMDREADRVKWVWATERPEAVPAPRADFAQLYAWMEEARKEGLRTALEFHFAEIQNRSASYVKKWERVLAFSRPGQGSASGRANAQDFEIQFGSGGMEFGKLVDDPGSAGGKAVRIGTARNGPVAKLAFANVAFDPDALYRLRVRLRVAKAENGRGEAFYASLDKDFKPVLEAYADVQSVADGYAWYDLGVTKLSENMTFGLGCGRYAKGGGRTATENVFLDGLSLEKVK